MRYWLLLVVTLTAACRHSASGARVAERDQLQREISGYRSIDTLVRKGVVADERRAIVSVSDTLFRDLLFAALPVAVDLPGSTTVTVDRAEVTFRGNVARVDLGGEIRRHVFPAAQARVTLRGALDSLTVDSSRALRARLTIDDVTVDEPAGVPGALSFLTPIVREGLPQLTAALPSVAIPIQLDAMLQLPGFGPEGSVYVHAVHAPVNVTASRVIAFQDRLWVFLMIDRGAFTSADSSAR